jgi:hypothetical protein
MGTGGAMDATFLMSGLALALGFGAGVLYERWRIRRKLDAIERRVNELDAQVHSKDRRPDRTKSP